MVGADTAEVGVRIQIDALSVALGFIARAQHVVFANTAAADLVGSAGVAAEAAVFLVGEKAGVVSAFSVAEFKAAVAAYLAMSVVAGGGAVCRGLAARSA